jgi:hypothetical protein
MISLLDVIGKLAERTAFYLIADHLERKRGLHAGQFRSRTIAKMIRGSVWNPWARNATSSSFRKDRQVRLTLDGEVSDVHEVDIRSLRAPRQPRSCSSPTCQASLKWRRGQCRAPEPCPLLMMWHGGRRVRMTGTLQNGWEWRRSWWMFGGTVSHPSSSGVAKWENDI